MHLRPLTTSGRATPRPARSRPGAAGLLVGVTAWGAEAAAQPAGLAWEAPARQCPDRDEVLERAHAAGLPRDVTAPWSAVAAVRRDPRGRWRMEMVIRIGGDRVVQRRDAATCAALAQLAGVDLALVVSTHAEAAPPPPPSAPPPPPPPAPEPPPTTPARDGEPAGPPRMATAPRSWRWVTGAFVATDVGLVPAPNVGAGLNVGVSWGAASVELRATWYPGVRVSATSARGTTGSADVGAWVFSARGCGHLAWGAWGLDGCAGVEGGALVSRGGENLTDARAVADPYVGALVTAGGAWRPSRWLRVALGVDGAVLLAPVERTPFVRIDNVGVVHEAARVHATLHAGVALTL